jgi:CubicO group peptidase (beta-lactamase class C family)
MYDIRLKRIYIIIFSIWSSTAHAQFDSAYLVSPDQVSLSSDTLESMNNYFHSLVDDQSLAGIQVAVLRHGKLVHFDTYGYNNIEEKIPLDDKSIFRIFSMTKPIVSVALMQLYEEGKFKLDDPLHKYIPAFKHQKIYRDSILYPAENPILILDLLRHTSGYNYGNGRLTDLNNYYRSAELYSSETNEEFVHKLSSIPLQFEPGTNWQYGLSTNICGYLVELFSGLSLDQYLRQFILEPLEMYDTHFQLPEDKLSRFTVGYGWNEEGGLFVSERADSNRYTDKVTLYNGGGGLVSSTYDYLRFCQMMLNKGRLGNAKILSAETIELMFTDHLVKTRSYQEERLRLPAGEASFGLGFAIRGVDVDTQEKVYGWGGAVGTYFKIDLDHDMAYVMMIQLSPYRHLGLRNSLQEFVNAAIED